MLSLSHNNQANVVEAFISTSIQVHYKSYFTTQYFKSFFTFLYINDLSITIHVIELSCHFISINYIKPRYNQTTFIYEN